MNKTTFYQTLNRPDIKSTHSCTFLCRNDRAYTFLMTFVQLIVTCL